MGKQVEDCVIQPIVDELVQTSDYVARRAAIAAFNAANQYVKRWHCPDASEIWHLL
jgi:xanthine dehydrogenase large subunit